MLRFDVSDYLAPTLRADHMLTKMIGCQVSDPGSHEGAGCRSQVQLDLPCVSGLLRIRPALPFSRLSLPRLLTIVREEGPAALYKGFAPKVLRLAPGGGVLLLVVEFTLGVFRKGEVTA